MTCPDGPLPDLPPKQEAMFEGAALAYARHRPGLPDAAARLLADTLRGRPSPVLLDLGTGTGQGPFALLSAGADLTHIEAVDVRPQMLHQARQALALLHAHAADGSPVEEATSRVLPARRPREAR
ncbi:class I SAM-dependent methyltransferase [Streptomyces populi]